jgi:rhomboid protease GluP
MDLQFVIALNIMAASAMVSLYALAYRPTGYAGWVLVNGLVLLAGGLALLFAPRVAAWITAALFVPLIVTPSLLSNLALRAEQRGKTDLAQRLASVSSWFHPTGDVKFNLALAEALRGETPDATRAALTRLRETATDTQRATVDVFIAAERDDWPAALVASRAPAAPTELKASEIRALGELGRRDEMVAVYEQSKTRLVGIHLLTAQLFVFAFTGRVARVDALLKGALAGLPADGKIFWRAVARQAADPEDALARSTLAAMAETALRAKTRAAAQRTLARTAPVPLSADALRIVDAADARMDREALRREKPLHAMYTTFALMAANIVMLLMAEWRGGWDSLDVLYRLGAMWPQAIAVKGEVWRLFTAAFLHLGPIHLIVNLLMLSVLGRQVESQLGWWRTLLVYLWCAVGSMALVYGLMWSGLIETNLLVGASGAIFGLLGVATALDAATWMRSRDRLDLNRLSSIAVILALQAAVDFSIPNVSFAAHATGFAMGLIAGGALAFIRRQPKGAAA